MKQILKKRKKEKSQKKNIQKRLNGQKKERII